jgi:hypothetical protein
VDLMKSLGGGAVPPKAVEPPKADAQSDDIMKALGGSPASGADTKAESKVEPKVESKPDGKSDAKASDSKAPAVKAKMPEEKAAEEIEKALRGNK